MSRAQNRPKDRHIQDRLNVLSWASPLVAVALLAFLFTSSIGQTQGRSSKARAIEQPLICNISAFYSIDANAQVSDALQIEGRGLATCKNEQGFSTESPISVVISARALGSLTNAGELSLSGNSSSFVIGRELSQMQDRYELKPFASDFNDKSSPTLLFVGQEHQVIIEMHFTSATQAVRKLEIVSMAIHFDETAPTLD